MRGQKQRYHNDGRERTNISFFNFFLHTHSELFSTAAVLIVDVNCRYRRAAVSDARIVSFVGGAAMASRLKRNKLVLYLSGTATFRSSKNEGLCLHSRDGDN